MALPTVHIDRWAFFNMLIASALVFKRETVGHLFGFYPTSSKNYFRVTNAFPLQHLKKRGFGSVETAKKSDRMWEGMISDFQGIKVQVVGGFHSHTEYGSYIILRKLSDRDIQNMVSEGYSLELVLTVTTSKCQWSAWKYTRAGSIVGHHARLRYVVDAYMLLGDKPIRGNIRRLRVRAPSAMRSLRRLHKKQ